MSDDGNYFGEDGEALDGMEPPAGDDRGGWIDPPEGECPVIPLGFDGARVVFALPQGEIRQEPAAKIAGMLKTDLFVCAAGQKFLGHWWDKGGEERKPSFQRDKMAVWFNRKCRDRGKWDKTRPVRGYGLWPSERGPVLHAGDALLTGLGGPEVEATPIAEALRGATSGPVWRLLPGLEWRRGSEGRRPPPPKAADVSVGAELRRIMGLWRWPALAEDGLSQADVALGWFGQALLAGCAPFRAHLMVTGPRGTGKTTLSRLLHAAASANAGQLLDSFSEPGLRAALSGESRPVFLDEAEASAEGPGPVDRAFEMLRRMSTGEGASRVQGDLSGGVTAQTAVGAVYLGAIYEPEAGDAMASRMVNLRLLPLGPAKGGADGELEAAIEWARGVAPQLLARAAREAGRYRADVALLKDACGRLKLDPRSADLVAALAAGRRLLLEDGALSPAAAEDEMAQWAPLIRSRELASSTQNPGAEALLKLFSANAYKHDHDRHLTVWECIRKQLKAGPHTLDWDAMDTVLKAMGLKVLVNPPDSAAPGPWLLVANKHDALARAFAGSQMRNWRSVLLHLEALGEDHAPQPCKAPVRFGYVKVRALAVPLTPWLDHPVALGGARPEADESPFDRPTASRSGVPAGGSDV